MIAEGLKDVTIECADKARRTVIDSIRKSSAVITHSSSAACESIVEGIPGRILVRKDAVGMYFHLGDTHLPEGVYNVEDVMGELGLKYLGKSSLQEDHFPRSEALNCDGLMDERPYSLMTKKELSELT